MSLSYPPQYSAPSYPHKVVPAQGSDTSTLHDLQIRNQMTGVVTGAAQSSNGVVLQIDIGCGNKLSSLIDLATLEDVGIQLGDTVKIVIRPNDVFVVGYESIL